MYTEQNQPKKNKKALLLLLVLGAFGFVVFKYTDVKDIVAKDSNTKATTCATTVIDNSYESNDVFLNISENGNITDVTPQKANPSVLGTSSSCSVSSANQYQANAACTIPGLGSGSTSLKRKVSSQADVSMSSINVPVRLLSGIFSVKDSNRQITMESPTYKPAGEQFDNKQILVNAVPGESGAYVKSTIIDGSVKQEAYGTKYTISTDNGNGDEGDGEAVISEYSNNDCGEMCNNSANANPDKSNKAAALFKNINYRVPGETEAETEDVQLTIDGVCQNVDPLEVGDTAYVNSCFNVWKIIQGTFGSLFPSSDWTSCENGEEEGCIDSASIAVKMSPMFKETNAYTTTRNKAAMSPSAASLYKSVYVITPCKALVSGQTVSIKCIWDMSYLFDEREAAEYDDTGGSDTPTLNQYKTFLLEESATRTDPLLSM